MVLKAKFLNTPESFFVRISENCTFFLSTFVHFTRAIGPKSGKIVSGHLFSLEPPPLGKLGGGGAGVWLIRYCLDTAEPPRVLANLARIVKNRCENSPFLGFKPSHFIDILDLLDLYLLAIILI